MHRFIILHTSTSTNITDREVSMVTLQIDDGNEPDNVGENNNEPTPGPSGYS